MTFERRSTRAGAQLAANRRLQPTLSLCAALTIALAGSAHAQDAATLHAKFESLQDKLAHNPYGRPLVLQSTQTSDRLEGEVYARVDQPYAMVRKALQGTDNWCGILILHLNVKMCHAQPNGLDMALGRKYDQPADDAYKLHFDYKPVADGPDYLRTELTSGDGPLGTKDYRIAVEVAPLDSGHTMLHMSYAYGFGFAAKMAMNAYLGTAGADKVGFSTTGQDTDGKPSYVGGVRGLVERNTMRYYLAIDDFVAAPAPSQLEQRLNTWFDATERWPRQLHEIEKNDYLVMKRDEAKR